MFSEDIIARFTLLVTFIIIKDGANILDTEFWPYKTQKLILSIQQPDIWSVLLILG